MKIGPRGLVVAVAMAALAGAADAQTASQPLVVRPYSAATATATGEPLTVKVLGGTARPAADLANPLDALAPTTAQARPMESAVFARTAVDRRFSRRGDVTGSVGFLCGLQPGHTEAGGAAAYGADPHGRFLGAKLSFAFR